MTPRSFLYLALGALAACSFAPDPDHGRFECKADADCGVGFRCVGQLNQNVEYCFAASEIAPEVCDGLDNDRNGVADDHAEGVGQACETGLADPCHQGTQVCEAGHWRCVATALDAGCGN